MSGITLKLTKHPLRRKVSIYSLFLKQFIDSILIYAGYGNVSQISTNHPVAEGTATGKHFLLTRHFIFINLNVLIVGRGQRNKHISKFDNVLQQEKLNEWGNTSLKLPPSAPSRRRSSKKLRTQAGALDPHDLSDKEDNDFDESSSETESVESGDSGQVSNDEVSIRNSI